ncbi:TetR/AcrR family transcriptional regulator [Amycolatopsis sp. H20-H5]|uniref:TetR/AcrR family transcriptional regulator n=1 Tax=Amycolatopsis sp. H20-H5 TaxID=3046309 RepID=UPI002DBBF38D|nr:helix-turn-helix domain-containing protein [Amycolatopsis sp. H20-H5]MEC3975882.1 helix-turn-helix domain-containing protein [Amycolatopsis sp. H20-H5]
MDGHRIGLESGSSSSTTGHSPPPAEPRRSNLTLPLLGGAVPRERADAARNRARILAVAQRLFTERGVANVTMDDVVAAAGVGKGTLFRRFTDKQGLAFALLDQSERHLQGLMLSGPPPLGPGAPPRQRLAAFAIAYLTYVDDQLDLVLMSETSSPGARFRSGAYTFWRQHCRYLLRQVVPDPELRADLLLAALSAEQVRYWLRDQHYQRDHLAAMLTALACASP